METCTISRLSTYKSDLATYSCHRCGDIVKLAYAEGALFIIIRITKTESGKHRAIYALTTCLAPDVTELYTVGVKYSIEIEDLVRL